MKCIGFCERDKFAVKSYRAMYDTEGEWYSDDITELKSADIPKADVWTAGSPCQNVSIAGGRTGIHGDRSGLFFKFADLLKGKAEEDKPEWIIVENVKGLLSSNKGYDFLEYLAELDESGYDCQWQIFNSKNYGVAQNRERVYTVGHLRTCGRREILPICGTVSATGIKVVGDIDEKGWLEHMKRVYSEDGVSPCLSTCGGGNLQPKVMSRQGYRVYDSDGVSQTLTGNSGGIAGKTGLYLVDQSKTEPKITEEARCITARYTAGMVKRKAMNSAVMEVNGINVIGNYTPSGHGAGRVVASDGVSPTVMENHGTVTAVAVEEPTINIKNGTKQGYDTAAVGDGVALAYPNSETRRGRVGHGIAQTLTTGGQNGTVVWNGKEVRIRRLTPRECFRLQGFPDEHFEKARAVNSDAQLYKQAGNAVTVNVVYAIGKKIAETVF